MTQRSLFLLAFILAVGGSAAAVASGDATTAAVVLAATVLIVGLVQFGLVLLPARISVQRQDELEVTDLIFYIHDPVHDLQRTPGDFLFQLHVAIANVGARKTVLSKLELLELISEDGSPARIPNLPLPIRAHRYDMRQVWDHTGGRGPELRSEQVHPPFVLSPDDVITLRLRFRRGIDWSPKRWTLDSLRELHDALSVPITGARLKATYRERNRVKFVDTHVPLVVARQNAFVDLMAELTTDFTHWPDKIHPVAFDFE